MIEFRRLFDAFYFQLDRYPQSTSLAERSGNDWLRYSTVEVIEKINALSRGLHRYGIKKGDKISIASNNKISWTLLDHAIMQLGAVLVPMYPNISPEEYSYI